MRWNRKVESVKINARPLNMEGKGFEWAGQSESQLGKQVVQIMLVYSINTERRAGEARL